MTADRDDLMDRRDAYRRRHDLAQANVIRNCDNPEFAAHWQGIAYSWLRHALDAQVELNEMEELEVRAA